MTRQEFIKMCGLLGISIPFQSVLTSYKSSEETSKSNFKGNVLIIGAGAAGLTAGHLLRQKGIEFQILEASSVYGGRMKRTLDFVDFPIPLGGEWLHVEKGVLSEIINDPSVPINVKTKPYDMDVDYALYEGEEVYLKDIGFKIDQKFINSSWFDFFEQYVVPSVQNNILFNAVVKSIDYSKDKIFVNTSNGEFTADKIIITTPVKLLQTGSIAFTPQLPEHKREAINDVTVWDGFKAFIEFSEKFYPAAIGFDIGSDRDGEKLYYDAAYGQNSNRHVLGLFTVGSGTLPYRELSDKELIEYMLNELDEIFDNKASSNYIKHTSQNWNKEPFAKGAYVYNYENWRRVRTLGKSVSDKLYFAGTSYTTGEDWGSVHTAARSAIRAVNEIT
ncbi:MAG: amine oxidase [Winogradskyella sp.]|uniref:flavin monoamine oxidase family protein n=1 Tax=Winogradskyella sp. TaxID=1883156 RepID=UPI000F3ADA0C|nr:NAD(P)/FAD-dependent oxidoreductase [Winogradskyella sp.]RNC87862.1 MAG: amine oxidase [Winogradskyella sp.]